LIYPTPLAAVVGWDEIPAPPCMVMLGFHPSLRERRHLSTAHYVL